MRTYAGTSHAREGMRQSEVNLVKAVAERDRFEAILDKVGSGAMDELELRCQEAEQMRFRSEGELSKLRAEINWQASARMDDKLSLQSVEDELANVRSSKRQVESKLMEMEDEVEKVSSQLRAKKKENLELRKRLDSVVKISHADAPPSWHTRYDSVARAFF